MGLGCTGQGQGPLGGARGPLGRDRAPWVGLGPSWQGPLGEALGRAPWVGLGPTGQGQGPLGRGRFKLPLGVFLYKNQREASTAPLISLQSC